MTTGSLPDEGDLQLADASAAALLTPPSTRKAANTGTCRVPEVCVACELWR
jgi:hypothetical protein